MSGANEVANVVGEQVMPTHNDQPALWDLVLADIGDTSNDAELSALKSDMKARDVEGTKKYHTRLQAFNGRDALVDAYQEVLDGIVYTKQCMVEGEKARQYALGQIYENLLGTALAFRTLLNERHVRKEMAKP